MIYILKEANNRVTVGNFNKIIIFSHSISITFDLYFISCVQILKLCIERSDHGTALPLTGRWKS